MNMTHMIMHMLFSSHVICSASEVLLLVSSIDVSVFGYAKIDTQLRLYLERVKETKQNNKKKCNGYTSASYVFQR